jgi:hypothetical protein
LFCPCGAQRAEAELADLEVRHTEVMGRVASLEGQLERLVDQEQQLLSERLEGKLLNGCSTSLVSQEMNGALFNLHSYDVECNSKSSQLW